MYPQPYRLQGDISLPGAPWAPEGHRGVKMGEAQGVMKYFCHCGTLRSPLVST